MTNHAACEDALSLVQKQRDQAMARADKAEHERDEARANAYNWEATAEVWGKRALVAESRPLTPDAITDEMVQRLRDEERALGLASVSSEETARLLLTAALTEPPKRPEGAERWEDWLIHNLDHETLTDQQIADLADRIAEETNR